MKMSPGSIAAIPRSAMVASSGNPRWAWNAGSPIPWATIRTEGSKIAQPKSRLSLMMWLYAVLIMVIRIRSAAALNAARTSSTVTGSIGLDISASDFDDEKAMGIDRQPITGLEDRGGARLL